VSAASEEVEALRGTHRATFKDLITHPQFRKLLAAMTVSSLGDWVGFVAVSSLVVRLAEGGAAKSFAVAGVMIARMLPSILFGPLAGVLADRMDRRRLMQVADIARAGLYALMPLIGVLWGLIALSFVIECLALLWTPARDAMIPGIVPRRQLQNANSITLGTTYGTLPFGGVIFTILAAIAAQTGIEFFREKPEALALWVDGATFVFSAIMISRLDVRPPARGTGKFDWKQAGKDMLDGVRFLRGHSLASAMTLSIVLAFVGVGSVIALGPVFAESLNRGATAWGVLVTSLGIGMALGIGLLGVLVKFIDRELLFPLSMLGSAISLFILAVMTEITLAAPMVAVMGFFVATAWVTGYTLLQENVADEFRGRTFAALTILARMGLFLSLAGFPLASGALTAFDLPGLGFADSVGVRLALWIGGAVVVLGAFSARRGMSRYRVSKPRPLSLRSKVKVTPRRGVFVVFEGVEGAGKGTQIRLAREFLESEGFEVLVTREPGGTELGETIRRILLDHETGYVESRAEAMMFAASRAQHAATVIRPALEDGKVVLCDRYIDSSIAYQGFARGLGEQDILNLNVWATQGLFPDFVILLHIEPELGLLRTTEGLDRIEAEEMSFHAKVADAFLRIAEEHPERYAIVDSSLPPHEVHKQIAEALLPLVRGKEDADGDERPKGIE
jgi:dTMP kinase